MGKTAERTARRKAQAEKWRKELSERKSRLKALGYDVFLSFKSYGEETWCYHKDGKLIEGLGWASENAVVTYLENKLSINPL